MLSKDNPEHILKDSETPLVLRGTKYHPESAGLVIFAATDV